MNDYQQMGRIVLGILFASCLGTFILIGRTIARPSLLNGIEALSAVCLTCIVVIVAQRWWRTF